MDARLCFGSSVAHGFDPTEILVRKLDGLTNARELMEISPRTAHEMLVKACRAALALRGRQSGTDAMLVKLATIDLAASSPSQSPALLERLEQLLAASGG